MPAKTTIFNARAQETHTFALGPRNTISFSPSGRFVLVAGFGNLAGQMDIYDLSKNYSKICTIEGSNASVCEWSPDGSHILTATISPRLRVDNGIRIWHVGGGLMFNEDMTELYHVCWRPQDATLHPSPSDPLNPVPVPHASALEYLGRRKAPTKPAGAYRPPGARGTSTPLHFKREDEGGAAFTASNGTGGSTAPQPGGSNGFGRPRRQVPGAELAADPILPPGAAPGGGVSLAGATEVADENLSKTALKNKKKREAKKAKEAAERQQQGLEVEGLENAPKGPRAMSRSPERRPQGHHQRNRSGFEHNNPAQGRSPQRRDPRERGSSRNRGWSDANAGSGNGASAQHPSRGQQQQQQQQQQYQQQQYQQQQYQQQQYQQQQVIPPPQQLQQQQVQQQQLRQQQQVAQPTQTPPAPIQTKQAAPPPDVTVTSPGTGNSQHEKKVRSLLKKMRAIEELKMRQAGGEKLEDTQIRKIDTEEGVRKELAALGEY
jgi:translation initiation factor 2A